MQKHGWREFYKGETAHRMVADFQANGGIITAEDLEKYEAIEREPLRISYRGYPVLVTPPHSAGGTVLAVSLNVMEQFEMKLGMEVASRTRHLQIEAMSAGNRAGRLVSQGMQRPEDLITRSYAESAARSISLDHASPASAASSPEGESEDTT